MSNRHLFIIAFLSENIVSRYQKAKWIFPGLVQFVVKIPGFSVKIFGSEKLYLHILPFFKIHLHDNK